MNKKIQTLMKTALLWSKESYCKRKKVGCVLAKDDRILATGYNGTISGQENICEETIIEYNEKQYKSIWDFVEKYKIKLFNNPFNIENDYLYQIKINLYTIDNENKKIYFYINNDEYLFLKNKLYKKSQKEKLKILNEFFNNQLEKMIINELRRFGIIKIKEVTNEFTLHAEQNVISYCAKNGIPTKDTELFVTLSPCKTCAKLIVQAGIKKVYYLEEYRDTSGIEFLKQFIEIEKIEIKD